MALPGLLAPDISDILFSSSSPSLGTSTDNPLQPDIFSQARETYSHSAPAQLTLSPRKSKGKKVAFVVFNGRKLGVFYDW
jgi:hypothetical protein